ncbi:MAG: Ig-like domain-containing protein [Luteolibacter sp.]
MITSRLALAANSGGALHVSVSAPPEFPARKPITGGHGTIFTRLAILAAVVTSLFAHAVSLAAPAVSLQWDPNPETDIASYELSYGTAAGNYTTVVNVGQATTASVTGLTGGQTYFFAVAAYNADGQKSPASAEISYQVAAAAPDYVPQTGWTLQSVDSAETPDFAATAAFDGDPATFWHTRWSSNITPPPHDLQINMGTARNLNGFRYLPRQDNYSVGNIAQYEFYVSMDATTWGTPVASGTFASGSTEKEILFSAKRGQFIRLRALSEISAGNFTNVAELRVLEQQGEIASQAPVALAKSVTTTEDTPLAILLSGTDANGDSLTYAIVTSPTKGTLSGTPPNLTYTPQADYNGSDSFKFKANDGGIDSAAAAVSITVTAVNDAPVVDAKSLTATEDTASPVVLTGSDKDGNSLTYSIVSSPTNGTLTGTSPNLSYLPNGNFNGSDSFTYRAYDGSAYSSAATVSITVTAVNDAPLAVSKSVTTLQDTSLAITLAGSDAEGSALTYAIVSGPANGELAGTAPNLTYAPSSNFSGSDSFTFRTHDGTANSATATISITVTAKQVSTGVTLIPQNGWTLKYVDSEESAGYPGTYAFDGKTTTFWHTKWKTGTLPPPPHEIQINLGSSKTINGFRYLPRQDGPTVGNISQYEFYVSADGTNWGSPVATGTLANTKAEKEIIFTPKTGRFVRLRELTEANGGTECNLAELNLLQGTIANQPPAATAQSLTTPEDTELPIALTGTDPENSVLAFSLVTPPAHGELVGTPPNLTYIPNADFNGSDNFTFKTNDGASDSSPATVAITVAPVDEVPGNIAPAFDSNPILASATEDSDFSGQLAATDANPGDTLIYSKISGPAWLSVSRKGELSGTPLNGNVGLNTFSVKVTDPSNASANAVLKITVANTNDAPAFKLNPTVFPSGSEGEAYVGQTVAGSATDPDAGDTITYAKKSGPTWLVVAANGTLGGTPPVGSKGLHQFTIRAIDTAGGSAETTLQIRILENSLPLPWSVDRLGSKNLLGGARYASGRFTLTGAGVLAKTADAGNFGWQTLTGDGEISARVVNTDESGKAPLVGLMIRQSLATNSRHVFIGADADGDYSWLRRANTGGSTAKTTSNNATPAKVWLRLVRKGDTFTAYKSNDGDTWKRVGVPVKIKLPKNCYVGLAVSSGNNSQLSTTTFSNVSVTP